MQEGSKNDHAPERTWGERERKKSNEGSDHADARTTGRNTSSRGTNPLLHQQVLPGNGAPAQAVQGSLQWGGGGSVAEARATIEHGLKEAGQGDKRRKTSVTGRGSKGSRQQWQQSKQGDKRLGDKGADKKEMSNRTCSLATLAKRQSQSHFDCVGQAFAVGRMGGPRPSLSLEWLTGVLCFEPFSSHLTPCSQSQAV